MSWEVRIWQYIFKTIKYFKYFFQCNQVTHGWIELWIQYTLDIRHIVHIFLRFTGVQFSGIYQCYFGASATITPSYQWQRSNPEGKWMDRLVKCMMTSSNGNIFRVTGHLCGEFTGPRWIPHTKASDAELWCVWINDWVNNREAGDLRRYRAHHDVIVLEFTKKIFFFVLRSEYFRNTRPLPWLLMPWLLGSPGHRHPQHQPPSIRCALSSMDKDFNHRSIDKW